MQAHRKLWKYFVMLTKEYTFALRKSVEIHVFGKSNFKTQGFTSARRKAIVQLKNVTISW